jgi:hypothetical protein
LKEAYTHFLLSNSMYIEETFDYSKIHIENNYIQYNNIRAKQLVFAEGFGLHNNPYFNNLPLDGTKGELLIIKSENLNLIEISKPINYEKDKRLKLRHIKLKINCLDTLYECNC